MTVRLGVRTIVQRGSAADAGIVNVANAPHAHRERFRVVTRELTAMLLMRAAMPRMQHGRRVRVTLHLQDELLSAPGIELHRQQW